MRRFPLLVTALITLAALVYISERSVRAGDAPGAKAAALTPGTQCVVYLRGDACGGAPNYIPAARNCPSVSGTIISSEEQWLILDNNKIRTYVPRNVILLVDVSQK